MTNQNTIPNNHVLAVLHGDNAARVARDEVARAGYAEVSILGEGVAQENIEASGEESNPITGLIKRLAGHLSEQVAFLEQYEEQARNGSKVIAVKVDNHEQAQEVGGILSAQGAVDIRFFGRFAVSDLSPATNPSAPSDERP